LTNKASHIDDAAIKLLVDHFYEIVIKDEVIGPVFHKAIGDDITQWQSHLLTMYRFWSSVMLTSGRYKGNPVAVHKSLEGIKVEMFTHWLDLWDGACDDIFEAPQALAFKTRARRIAGSLMATIFSDGPDELKAYPA